MKLNLKKKQLKNLSKDHKVLPQELTPQIAGGGYTRDCRTGGVVDNCVPSAQC